MGLKVFQLISKKLISSNTKRKKERNKRDIFRDP